MRFLPGVRRRGNESVKFLVINMFVHWTSQILTHPIDTLRVPEGVCLWPYSRSPVIVAIRTGPNNLLPNVMLQPFNDASHSLGSQKPRSPPRGRHRSWKHGVCRRRMIDYEHA